MAGVLLHQRIIENTRTDGTDQSHLDVIHLSLSRLVPDRTEYLTGIVSQNPAEGMIEVLSYAADAVSRHPAGRAVAGFPCNTFHAPRIWDHFAQRCGELYPEIEPVHMLDVVARRLVERYGGGTRIGLLSTTGTRNAGVYRVLLEQAGLDVIEVEQSRQDDVHQIIYDRSWGIKARSPVTETARSRLIGFLDHFAKERPAAVVLGCTELPLAAPGNVYGGMDLIDPLDLLAAELVARAGHD